MNIVQPSQMPMPTNATVLYISATNGDVYSLNIGTQTSKKIFSLQSTNRSERLIVEPSRLDTNKWDVVDSKSQLILSNLDATAGQFWRDAVGTGPTDEDWFNFGKAVQLSAATNSDWSFRTGFWPIEGLRGENSKSNQSIHFSLETPFVAWVARSATQLPGDYVVFQLGNQVCILETSTKKIAMLSKGHSPVVILEKP
jgi:hypothetical protein